MTGFVTLYVCVCAFYLVKTVFNFLRRLKAS